MKNKKKLPPYISIGILIICFLSGTIILRFFQIRPSTSLTPSLKKMFQVFDFNERGALKQWEEKVFHGKVKYWVELKGPGGFVHSESTKSASAIFFKIKFDISEYPHLLWKWRVSKFPDKTGETDGKKRDDFAARVYVIFSKGFFTNFKCVEYLWDETLPEGTQIESPYSDKIKQLVVRSGFLKDEKWASEHRNVYEDYEMLFGEKPSMKVAAIALMTDAEGTESEAEGFFDDILIGRV